MLILFLKEWTKLLLDYLIMVQHTRGRKQKGDVVLVKHHPKKATNHLIENCYFNARNVAMKQAIGIPMGIDPAPFLANLFFIFL